MKKKKQKLNIFRIIISLLLVLCSFALFYFVNKLNVLEPKLLMVFGGILILIYAFILFKLFRKKTKKWSRAIFYIFSIILIIIYIVGIRYIITTINFFENLSGSSTEKQTYKVLVLKDSEYNEISNLNDKMLGFMSTNPNIEKAKEKLRKKTNINYESKDKVITDILIDLNNKKIDAMVLDSSILSMLGENDKKITENYKVIYEYNIYINKRNRNKKVNVTKDSFIFYISGSDSRSGISDTDRSDVNILAVINPKTKKILLVNTPRDYYVQLHGTSGVKDKLTHAGIYGVESSMTTLEDLYDIGINYYAKVSFTTLINSVDVMGGIDINSSAEFTVWSNKEKCKIKVGTQHVSGNCALAFARERKAFTGGDYARGENQQQVITAMIRQLSNPSILVKYNDIMNAIDGSFETNMSYNQITSLIKSQLTSATNWDIESISAGGTGGYDYTYSLGNQKLYVTYPNEKSVDDAQERINEVLYEK